MVNSEYITKIYKFFKISLGAVMRNPEILKFVSDHLKNKKMCKHAYKTLPFVLRQVPDQYKAQQRSNEAVLKSGGSLEFVPDQYETQKCAIRLLITIFMQ